MKKIEYVFWYANEYYSAAIDCLMEYCNLIESERKPIFFSSSKVDKTKNNIFFIKSKILGLGLEELLDWKDEIKWCDDNGITVIYDHSWESLNICIPENNIQEIKYGLMTSYSLDSHIKHKCISYLDEIFHINNISVKYNKILNIMSNCHLIISLIASLRIANLKLNPSSRIFLDRIL